jgi:RimJ/RimL family protein N-acetyltransferase
MRSRHVAMSLEEFRLLPLELAWKQEYWNGQAHFTPRFCVVHASVATAPRQAKAPVVLRPAVESDEPELVRCFQEAFADTYEYCDYKPEDFVRSSRDCLRHFFAGLFHRCLPASRAAVAPPAQGQAGAIVGGALALSQTEEKDWALLDMVFVAPSWQRRGVATALVSAVLTELHATGWGRLVSRYQPGNAASQAWHQRFGFRDEPDLGLAQLRLRAVEHELWRREQLGVLTPAAQAQLSAQQDQWRLEVAQRQQALAEGKQEEAYAWRRFSPKRTLDAAYE